MLGGFRQQWARARELPLPTFTLRLLGTAIACFGLLLALPGIVIACAGETIDQKAAAAFYRRQAKAR